MASFLNSTIISNLTGIFQNHFDTFSTGNNNYVTIFKEPIKSLNTNINSFNVFPGYETDSIDTTTTYTIRSGVYPAMIIYPNSINDNKFAELKFTLGSNELMIKVKENCKDYIIQGKTELIKINNQNYSINPSFTIQNYFGSHYFYFKCTETQ